MIYFLSPTFKLYKFLSHKLEGVVSLAVIFKAELGEITSLFVVMVKRVRGKRGGHSRQQMRKHREKTTVNAILQKFSIGDKVVIDIDSSVQGGMPHPRFQGNSGEIIDKSGDCYEVSIMDGNKAKMLIVHPVHLKKEK